LTYHLLPAADPGRKRGYPLNVGLRYCLERDPPFEFLFFLDDDDTIYPFFTRVLSAAFLCTSADLVYTPSMQRGGDGQLVESRHRLDAPWRLLSANFITINSYAIRAESLRRAGVWVDEDFDYLEDWNFLIDLLAAGLWFEPCPAHLSEFRITSDGNVENRKRPDLWQRDLLRIRRKVNSGRFRIPGPQLLCQATPPRTSAQCEIPAGELAAALRQSEWRNDDDARKIADLQARVAGLQNSLSWRMTAPLRAALDAWLRWRGDYRRHKADTHIL
jgi:hypothetical protein